MLFVDGSEVAKMEVGTEGATVSNLSFNFDGSMMAAACKDRVVRLVDPRAAKGVVDSSAPIGRNLRVAWCSNHTGGEGLLVAVSSSATGMRQLQVHCSACIGDGDDLLCVL